MGIIKFKGLLLVILEVVRGSVVEVNNVDSLRVF